MKPHASPVFHAIQYLLGNLDQRYLTTLRDFKGLQAYPSRTKDPDYVDFSMGSVGLGAIAPNFASLAEQYVHGRFTDSPEPTHRFVSTVGDAELDEGTVWEAVIEPALATSPRVLWVVDVNRQSLDRIIPGIRVQVWREMLAANGWRVIDAKYGSLLQEAFAAPKGELLREAIDSMPNETYQRLLREPDNVMREWLPRYSRFPQDLAKLIGEWDDDHLRRVYQNLGGHDFATLREAYAEADAADRPSIIFAYTFKGWRLPTVGDPQNHSVLLSNEQLEEFRGKPRDHRDVAPPRPRLAGGQALRRDRRALPLLNEAETRAGVTRPRSPGPCLSPLDVYAAGVRRHARRPGAGVARRRRAHGDGQPRRGVEHQPWRLDQPRGRVERGGGRGDAGGHHPARPELARTRWWTPHSAWDFGIESLHAAGPARPLPRALRRAPAAHRHPLRPVHRARP